MPLAAMTDALTNPFVIGILVYLLALVAVGARKARVVKGSEDFMVAGRSLPWYVLVGSLLATWIGSGSLFSGAGLGYRNGPAGMWSSGGAWLGIVLVFFIARRIRNFEKVTIPDIFQARYGSTAAMLAMVTTVIAYLTIVSYQFRGGGKVLSIITDGAITMEAGIVITAVFAVVYTVLAGMYSVVYTDVVNGVLMTIGTLAALVYLTMRVGGVDEVVAAADAAGKWSLWGNWTAERVDVSSGPILALSFFVPTMLLLLGDANMYQRIFSAESGGAARKAVFFWVIGVVILESAVSFLGLTGAVAVEQGILQDAAGTGREAALAAGGSAKDALDAFKDGSESIIPSIALEGLPLILGLLLVGTMMAIIVSTADSFLLIPATNLTRDVYQRFVPGAPEKSVLLVSRVLVLVLGGVAFLLVSQFRTVLDAAVHGVQHLRSLDHSRAPGGLPLETGDHARRRSVDRRRRRGDDALDVGAEAGGQVGDELRAKLLPPLLPGADLPGRPDLDRRARHRLAAHGRPPAGGLGPVLRRLEQQRRPLVVTVDPWLEAASFEELCELGAAFLEGDLGRFPGWLAGEVDEETEPYVPALAAACRGGFLTTSSQPGHPARREHDTLVFSRRSFVTGFCDARGAKVLEGLETFALRWFEGDHGDPDVAGVPPRRAGAGGAAGRGAVPLDRARRPRRRARDLLRSPLGRGARGAARGPLRNPLGPGVGGCPEPLFERLGAAFGAHTSLREP